MRRPTQTPTWPGSGLAQPVLLGPPPKTQPELPIRFLFNRTAGYRSSRFGSLFCLFSFSLCNFLDRTAFLAYVGRTTRRQNPKQDETNTECLMKR